MPRGVYERKSAQQAAPEQSGAGPVAGETPVKKPAKKTAKKRIRNRKPAHAKAAPVVPATPPKEPPADKPKVQAVSSELLGTPDFCQPGYFKNRRVSIDAISFEELKAYAQFIGLSSRDIERLNEERLRVNCKTHLFNLAGD